MKATAHALKERSLDLFKKALKDFQEREYLWYSVRGTRESIC